jgi:hypothetical protein
VTEPTNTELIAVLVAVTDGEPRILTIDGQALPSGSFISAHRSLQAGAPARPARPPRDRGKLA